MKKLMFVAALVVLATSFASAQASGTVTGNIAYVPTADTMGAHENGGRGCAGCHAPHSGGRGSGGNIIAGTGTSFTGMGVSEGDIGLWGTDTMPIQTGYPGGITFDTAGNGGAGFPTGSLATLTWSSGALYTGLVTCLSCHDGNVSTGAMMSGTAYEQTFGLLNFASVSNLSNRAAKGPTLYGSQPIPTLLGNDNGTLGDYANDHPVGPQATILSAFGGAPLASVGLHVITNATVGAGVTVTVDPGSEYANMVATYGYPAIAALVSNGPSSDGSTAYVVCTTCHNQHVMNVYQSKANGSIPALPIAGVTATATVAAASLQTFFFVNGPYNPGAPFDPTHEPSTMRFCQQCHFSFSSEAYGATNIGTAF